MTELTVLFWGGLGWHLELWDIKAIVCAQLSGLRAWKIERLRGVDGGGLACDVSEESRATGPVHSMLGIKNLLLQAS